MPPTDLDDPLWGISFLTQQLKATFAAPFIALILFILLFWLGPLTYLIPLVVGAIWGFRSQNNRPTAIQAGIWVFVLPTIILCWAAGDNYTCGSYLGRLRCLFFPPKNAFSGMILGTILLVPPFLSSVGYSAGLLAAYKQQRRPRPSESNFD